MLYSSEGLISACGLVPSVFGLGQCIDSCKNVNTLWKIWLSFEEIRAW